MRVREVSGRMVRPGARRGLSLLEVAAAMWALGLVLFLGVTTLLGAMKVEKAASAADRQQTLANSLADQFRADVALTTETPESLGRVKAGPTCVILRLAGGKHVLYRAEAGRLERAELAAAGAAPYWISLGGEDVAGEFARGGTDRRLLTLTLSKAAGFGSRKRVAEITAALGGDLR